MIGDQSPSLDNERGDLLRGALADESVAIAIEDSDLGHSSDVVEAEQHDAVLFGGCNELADVAPFQLAPALRRILRAKKEHDEFALSSVKIWQINIEIRLGKFGLVEFVVENSLSFAVSCQRRGDFFNDLALLSWEGKSDGKPVGR